MVLVCSSSIHLTHPRSTKVNLVMEEFKGRVATNGQMDPYTMGIEKKGNNTGKES